MTSPLRIIVTGQIAQYPLGGVTWFYLHYVLGFQRLGHDVFYIEDTAQWPYNSRHDELIESCEFNVEYLAKTMERFGLRDKWAYLFPWQSQWFGLSEQKRKEVIKSADLLVNVSGTLAHPQEYREVPIMVYIDTDPVFTQVKLANGQIDFQNLVDLHDIQFSYGERLSETTTVPATGHTWHPTRAPVVISEWNPAAPRRDVFTTVMNWTSHNSVNYRGQTYGQKDIEFKKFLDLPRLVAPTKLEIGIGSGKNQRTPYDLLKYKGWNLVNPADVCPDLDSFRTYTESSMAEFCVGKNGYVVGQSGWFSERSARYLAAGRPVVVQETGFSKVLPTGKGILPFTTLEEAVNAIREVKANYDFHSKAAREIAEEYFGSDKVLSSLLAKAMTTTTRSETRTAVE